jgi:hypothetical protein
MGMEPAMSRTITKSCEICEKTFTVSYKLRGRGTCSRECSYRLRSLRRRETSESETGVTKTCPACGGEFLDPTRKSGMTQCGPCSYASMVDTRTSNGSYVQSPERRQWQSEMMREKYASGWNPNTPEHRAKLSIGMRERWASGKMKILTRSSSLRKYGVDHHTQRIEYIESLKRFSFAKHGIRDDLGIYFRSSWEANFARYLNYLGKKWSYEPQSFRLNSGKRYVPDFWVEDDNAFYEVKGLWVGSAKQKVEDFIAEYEHRLILLDVERYKEISRKYSKLISCWEH